MQSITQPCPFCNHPTSGCNCAEELSRQDEDSYDKAYCDWTESEKQLYDLISSSTFLDDGRF